MKHVRPFFLSALIIIVDQLTKIWVVANIPQGTIHSSLLGDFIWICHVRNSAIGFSIGAGLPELTRRILFIAFPLILMAFLVWYLLKSKDFTNFQKWALAGIIGGGLGNIIDRIFRADWVVDFISVRVYGFLGFERWPTFNVADSSIVVCSILLMITIIFQSTHTKRSDSQTKELSHE